MYKLWFIILNAFFFGMACAQDNRIDIIGPDAPELADFGEFDIGVRTVEITIPNSIDVLNTPQCGESVLYDRTLTLEIWYPAKFLGEEAGTIYRAVSRNPDVVASLNGRAVRGAEPLRAHGPYPSIIISHGWPGNRYLVSHTGENLASKGYIVTAIDHSESTYDDQQAITSTLYHRPLDQMVVLNALASFSEDSESFLNSVVDAENTGIIGYSMGGYGLINNLGGGFSEKSVNGFISPPNSLLEIHSTLDPSFIGRLDPRIKAGFAIAPWGMNAGFWELNDLAGVTVPTFYLAGDQDKTAGYENGTKKIFQGTVNSNRYLLTFIGAGHNAGAPIPLPTELNNDANIEAAEHYRDDVWDNVEMNNIMDHYATIWFDHYLKGITRERALNTIPSPYQERLVIEHLPVGE
mgnify:FL=1